MFCSQNNNNKKNKASKKAIIWQIEINIDGRWKLLKKYCGNAIYIQAILRQVFKIAVT